MRIAVLLILLVVGACRKDQPPAPTPEQSAQLNDADAMLNAMSNNEEGPEQRPGPSNSSE